MNDKFSKRKKKKEKREKIFGNITARQRSSWKHWWHDKKKNIPNEIYV